MDRKNQNQLRKIKESKKHAVKASFNPPADILLEVSSSEFLFIRPHQ
jgi:hypothetical protein